MPYPINVGSHTMATRAVRIADERNKENEKNYLRQAIQNNGYMLKNINIAITRAENKNNNRINIQKPER